MPDSSEAGVISLIVERVSSALTNLLITIVPSHDAWVNDTRRCVSHYPVMELMPDSAEAAVISLIVERLGCIRLSQCPDRISPMKMNPDFKVMQSFDFKNNNSEPSETRCKMT